MLGRVIGQNIKDARKAKGLSLEKLAAKVNPPTSYQQLSRLEQGRMLTIEWIEKIAQALDMNPLELISAERVQFSLDEQVANELARQLAVIVLEGEVPEHGIVQVLSLALQELTQTFSRHPQAYHDPKVASPVIDLVTQRYAREAS